MVFGIDASQANRKIRSGTEWYAFHLIQEFKKLLGGRRDVTVRLYTRDLLQADLASNLPENFEVKILKWPLKYFWGQGRLSWEMLTNPPDILFCPAHTIPLTPILSRKGRGNPRVFTTLHDVGFEDHPELYDKLSLWYHRFSARLAVRKAYQIFTVSEFSKNRIVENYDCPEEKITVTYLGCNPSRPSAAARGTLPSPGEGKKGYILFLGRLEPKKNVLNLVKGYEIVQSLYPYPQAGEGRVRGNLPDLVLAGRKVRIRDIEQYLSDRQSLQAKIKFLGYIKEADKTALYQNAALFLFPTLYEGFGLPILEAQASGIPVITSNTASNPEIAGKGALIVDPESPQEIAEAISKVLSDKGLRDELIKKGFENVRRFSWEQTARQTLACIID